MNNSGYHVHTDAKPHQVAIIGGGLGAFMAYVVLRFRGVPVENIAVVSPSTIPYQNWYNFVYPIWQYSMRSESAAHFFPTDSPGLATLEALKTWSLKPIILNWFDKYHPTVESMLDHIAGLVRQTGYVQSVYRASVKQVHRHGDLFYIYNEHDQLVVRATHVIIAVGHGPVSIPEPVTKYKERHPEDTRVYQAFSGGSEVFPNETVVVMGNGLTSATLWRHILRQGGNVVAVSTNEFTMKQPLNTPRRYFSRRGIMPYLKQQTKNRLHELWRAKRGTFPPYFSWKYMFTKAKHTGNLTTLIGHVTHIEQDTNGRLRCLVRSEDGHGTQVIFADRVIAATGFKPVSQHPLWQDMITRHNLPMVDACLEVSNDFCLPTLSHPGSIAGVIGSASEWAIPCADSFGGMKIVAHGLADAILGKESWHPVSLLKNIRRWVILMTGGILV